MEFGYKVEVVKAYNFKKVGHVFKSYIDPIYNTKCTTKDPVERFISKLLLNSLYGMMGFRGDNTTLESRVEKGISTTSTMDRPEGHNTDYSVNVAIASAISAYARMLINVHLNRLPDVCYHDTDSISVVGELDPSMVSPTELGKFKHEHTLESAVYLSPKTYGLKEVTGKIKIAAAGIKQGLVSYEELINAVNGDQEALNKVYKFPSFKALLDNGKFSLEYKEIGRKLASNSISRIKVYYLDRATNIQVLVGSHSWKLEQSKILHPDTYFDPKQCTFIREFEEGSYNINNVTYSEESVNSTINKLSIKDTPREYDLEVTGTVRKKGDLIIEDVIDVNEHIDDSVYVSESDD